MQARQGGFTIVEMLVALSLFALLIPTLTVGVSTLTQINNRARDLTLISIIAENKIESLRSAGYNSIGTGSTDFTIELPPEIAGPKSAIYTIAETSGIKTVDIVITYSDYKKPRTITYKSLISEVGVAQ